MLIFTIGTLILTLCLLQGSTWETIYEHDDFQMLEPELDPESDDSDFEFEVGQLHRGGRGDLKSWTLDTEEPK